MSSFFLLLSVILIQYVGFPNTAQPQCFRCKRCSCDAAFTDTRTLCKLKSGKSGFLLHPHAVVVGEGKCLQAASFTVDQDFPRRKPTTNQ